MHFNKLNKTLCHGSAFGTRQSQPIKVGHQAHGLASPPKPKRYNSPSTHPTCNPPSLCSPAALLHLLLHPAHAILPSCRAASFLFFLLLLHFHPVIIISPPPLRASLPPPPSCPSSSTTVAFSLFLHHCLLRPPSPPPCPGLPLMAPLPLRSAPHRNILIGDLSLLRPHTWWRRSYMAWQSGCGLLFLDGEICSGSHGLLSLRQQPLHPPL